MLYDLAVIGGGAAGLAAAVAASRAGDRVIVLESSNRLGKKIMTSGNGRCNLMNTGFPRYYGDSDFACQVIRRCDAEAQKLFWHSIGLITASDSDNRVYPCTFQSSTVVSVLKNALRIYGTDTVLNTSVTGCVQKNKREFCLVSDSNQWFARRVLVATGGPAGLKSSDDCSGGYNILRQFGHSIQSLSPALVPLITDQRSISGLSGIRIRCALVLKNQKDTIIHREKGEILFTDYGVSGICAMQCARFIEGEGCYLELDLAGNIFPDDNHLSDELQIRKKAFSTMTPDILLIGMMNEKIAYAVMKQAGLKMQGETLNDLDDTVIECIIRSIRHYRIEIKGKRRMADAQVTAGGADCREFDPDNMESRIVPGLHAAGEILNTDGDCGGYNLMFAFGSGILAGMNRR